MATVPGTYSADTLYGSGSADWIFGLGGNDVIKGGGGADRIDGGTGLDMIFYSDSSVAVTVNLATGRGFGGTADGDTFVNVENVWGSSFNDIIFGNDSANELNGFDGSDVLNGGGGADILDGGSGNDTLKGGGGADLLIGGSGEDTADYSQSPLNAVTGGVIVDLTMNYGVYGDAEGDTFNSIENVTGSAYLDFIYGNDVANTLRGVDGDDRIFGYGGDDRLDGGNGNDRLDGGTGVDTMIGGTGYDLYYVDNAGDAVIETAGEGSDTILASASYTLSASAEIEDMFTTDQYSTASLNFTGNDFAQSITGNDGSNVIQGGGGYDRLEGRDGFDRLFAGDGHDFLLGGRGPDDMIGGTGADGFVYYETLETGIVAGAMDVIHDFNRAEGDRIIVNSMDANSVVAGFQGWTFVGATTSFTAPGQIGVSSDGVDTFILFNSDTDAIHEAAIRVLGVQTVDVSWFVL
jgi:Ca2+-binding RTX toxin-like protein